MGFTRTAGGGGIWYLHLDQNARAGLDMTILYHFESIQCWPVVLLLSIVAGQESTV